MILIFLLAELAIFWGIVYQNSKLIKNHYFSLPAVKSVTDKTLSAVDLVEVKNNFLK